MRIPSPFQSESKRSTLTNPRWKWGEAVGTGLESRRMNRQAKGVAGCSAAATGGCAARFVIVMVVMVGVGTGLRQAKLRWVDYGSGRPPSLNVRFRYTTADNYGGQPPLK